MRKLLFLSAMLFAAPTAAQDIALAPGETLLQISATGSAQIRPEIATMFAGVTTTGATAKEAIDANSRVAERIIAAMKAQGVEARDIQTQNINVSPQFSQPQYPPRPVPRGGGFGEDVMPAEAEQPRITGYIAQNQLQIRIRQIDRAPRLIDDLFNAGANNVYGPNLSVEDGEPAMKAARADAIRRMQAQAEDYAAALGKRIVRLTAVSDRGGFGVPSYNAIVVTGARMSGGPPAPPPPPPAPVEGGELQVSSSVWGDYILADR